MILSVIIAVSVNSALPAFLTERTGKTWVRVLSAIVLYLLSLFPIVPDFVPSFILSFAAFALYIFIFYKDAPAKMIAFCSLFFSIIGSWSFFTMSWIRIMLLYETTTLFQSAVFILIIILCIAYFSIFKGLVKEFYDKSALDSLTAAAWGYSAFIALCPPLLILMLVINPPDHLPITIMMIFLAMGASTAMFPLLYQAGKSAKLAEENSRLRERTGYYQELEEQQLSFRKYKHDLMNQFTVVATYLDLGENDKAIEFFKKLGAEFSELTQTFTDNTLVNAVLNSKCQKAHAQGLHVEVKSSIKELNLDGTELCTLIANSLDNAIEANPPDKIIKTELREKDGNFIFTCSNSYTGEIRRDADGSFITHKADKRNHGLGINNIKDAARSMGGTVEFTTDSSVFTVSALIPLRSNDGNKE